MPGLFISTFVNKIDKKGRVSVPAEFRRVLAGDGFQGVVVFKSLQHQALEACSAEHLERLSESLESQDLAPDELQAIETAIFGGSYQLPFDGEGRVVLPQGLLDFAGITEEAAFVGKRRTFEIWNPPSFTEHEASQRSVARSRNISLSSIIARAAKTKDNGRGDRS